MGRPERHGLQAGPVGRRLLARVCGVALFVGLVGLVAVGAHPQAALGAPQAAGGRSPCSVYQHGGTNPRWVTIGNSLEVSTYVRFSCPQWARPSHRYHLMIVADQPALSPEGAAGDSMMRSLQSLTQRLALEQNHNAHAGVTAFATHADTACRLYGGQTPLPECVEALAAQGQDGPATADPGAMAKGVYAGMKELLEARDRALAEDDGEPVVEEMLLLAAPGSADAPPGYCAGVRDAIDTVLDLGIRVTAVCLTSECAGSCLPDNVDHSHPYYEWDAVADELVREAYQTELRIRKFEYFEVLNPAIELDESSIDADGRYRDSDHSIRWVLEAAAPGDRQRLSYRAQPIEVGRYNVRLDGAIIAYDTWGDRLTHGISLYEIDVVEDLLSFPHLTYFPFTGELMLEGGIKNLDSRQ